MKPRLPAEVLRRRLVTGFVILAALIALGTVGYVLLEGWSVLDALYMTVITITTVGYREVGPLDGDGKVFTMVLLLFGVGTAFYLLTTFVALVIEGDLGAALGISRMEEKIRHLERHYILCGFGRVGQEIARELTEGGCTAVVVDTDSAAVAMAAERGYLALEGDATDEEVLKRAGVRGARALLAALDSDAGNTYIVLTARALNPDLYIVARAARRESEPRMLRAGADRVISPYAISGRRMAMSAMQPNVVDFIETLAHGRTPDQILAELEVTAESGLAGQTVADALGADVVALGLQRASGELIVGPKPGLELLEGDRLMIVGPEDTVSAMWAALGGRGPAITTR
jgi:voltage-gated potassium channel